MGDNPISAKRYEELEEKNVRVSVAWFGESVTKKFWLQEMFHRQYKIEELPPSLKILKSELDEAVAPYVYAFFGG